MNGEEAEREGDTELEAGSRLWAIGPEPDTGLKLTDHEIVTWAEVRRLTDWATQAPLLMLFEIYLSVDQLKIFFLNDQHNGHLIGNYW